MRHNSALLTATFLMLLTLTSLQTPPPLLEIQANPGKSTSSSTNLAVMPQPTAVQMKFQAKPHGLTPSELQSLQVGSRHLSIPSAPFDQSPVPSQMPSTTAASPAVGIESPTDFAVFTNSTLQLVGAAKSLVDEPSVAQNNQIIFYTGNWYAARSTNGGSGWSYLNPFGDMSDFCCDQDTLYNPSRGIFLWYRMGIRQTSNGTNRFRLGVSTDASLWFFYDVHPTNINLAWTGQFFDFVIMAFSDNYLYITNNLFQNTSYTNSLILRLSLDKLKSHAAFTFNYYATQNRGFAPVSGARQTMYFATHYLAESTLRLYIWNENSNTTSFIDIAHTSYTPTGNGPGLTLPSCPAPDGGNICKRLDDRILGGWLANGVIGFFWNVAQGGGFPEPYTYILRINETLKQNMDLGNEPILWNSGYAWVYAWIAPNSRGHLGLVAFTAGPTRYPTIEVGISDDITGNLPNWQFDPIAASTNAPGSACINGSSNPCWGDYLRVRAYNGTGNAWIATGYTLQGACSASPCGSIQPRYIVFGRIRDSPFNYGTITFLTVPSVVGSITFNGTTYRNGQSAIYNLTTYAALANIPQNHTFSRWNATGAITVSNLLSNPTSVTVAGPGNLTAILIPPNVTITFNTNPSNQGTISCSNQTFSNGQTARLPANSTILCTANPPSGFRFASWSGLSNGTSRNLSLFTHNGGTLKANFVPGAITLSPFSLLSTNVLIMAILWAWRRKRKMHFFPDSSPHDR